MAWTDEKRTAVIASYTNTMENEYDNDEARAAATTEVAAELAEIHGETVNGVINILNRAKVYIKKSAVKSTAAKATGTATGGNVRVNKAEAHEALRAVITHIDADGVDEEIIGKLTGKAALYLAGILQKATSE